MKTQADPSTVLLLFLLWGISGTVLAQPSYPARAPENLSPMETDVDMLTSYDLSGLSAQWWGEMTKDVDVKLRGSAVDQEQAMRKIIFLATYYPDKANFDRSTTELYNIWRFNRNEKYRIMALAALFANGDEPAMRLLAQRGNFATYAPWDPSPLVRRLTALAVARYYGVPGVEVGPLQPLNAQPADEDK